MLAHIAVEISLSRDIPQKWTCVLLNTKKETSSMRVREQYAYSPYTNMKYEAELVEEFEESDIVLILATALGLERILRLYVK